MYWSQVCPSEFATMSPLLDSDTIRMALDLPTVRLDLYSIKGGIVNVTNCLKNLWFVCFRRWRFVSAVYDGCRSRTPTCASSVLVTNTQQKYVTTCVPLFSTMIVQVQWLIKMYLRTRLKKLER